MTFLNFRRQIPLRQIDVRDSGVRKTPLEDTHARSFEPVTIRRYNDRTTARAGTGAAKNPYGEGFNDSFAHIIHHSRYIISALSTGSKDSDIHTFLLLHYYMRAKQMR